jgi:hypothetical protein
MLVRVVLVAAIVLLSSFSFVENARALSRECHYEKIDGRCWGDVCPERKVCRVTWSGSLCAKKPWLPECRHHH